MKLTASQEKKVELIKELMVSHLYNEDYEIKKCDIKPLYNKDKDILYNNTIILNMESGLKNDEGTYAYYVRDRIYVFISGRGKVTYYDKVDDKIKTFTQKDSIYTLICANPLIRG